MIPKYGCLLLGLLTVCGAAAQHPDDEYYPYAARQEERTPLLLTDSTLFYRAVQTTPDLYAEHTAFNLPYVSVKRRGLNYRDESASVGGVPLSSRYFGAMRLLGADEVRYGGLAAADGATGGAGGLRLFRFADDYPQASRYAAVSFTDRNYLAGARLSVTEPLGRGWSGTAALDARTGRDMHVEGVFTNALTASLRAAKRFGDDHNLSLTLIVPPSVRGTRLSSAEEAFRLTGDRLYNPAWGFQHGKVRNSRVRREFVPLAVVSYRVPVSQSTSLAADFAAEYGMRKYSALGWYDARTPMPDNYRYLPGYTGDRETEQAWRAGDARYTQIDWDEMIAQNRMAAGPCRLCPRRPHRAARRPELQRPVYNRARRPADTALRIGSPPCAVAQLQADARPAGCGVYHRHRPVSGGRRYLQQPSAERPAAPRPYDPQGRQVRLRLCADDAPGRCAAACRIPLRPLPRRSRPFAGRRRSLPPRVLREGAFPRRTVVRPFAPGAVYALYPQSDRRLGLLAPQLPRSVGRRRSRAADAADLFYQPQYNNRVIDDPCPERRYAAEINYSRTGETLTLRFSAYLLAMFDGVETRRYYDDMAGVFCDMAATRIGRMACGVEAAADIRLSYRWSLSLAASAGRYKFIRNPRITVISDVDNSVVDARAVSHLNGCTPGGAPQLTTCAELGYFGPKGWGFKTSAGYAGARYVEPSLLRRTERIARQGGTTREMFDAFTRQQRLGDAFTLDAALFKTFWFDRSRLTASLILRNLLGDGDTVYSAYESQRVRRIRSGDTLCYAPHATRLTYAYPRSFYLTVSYRF